MPPAKQATTKRKRGGVPGNRGGKGREPALTAETRRALLRFLQAGMPLEMSARLAGIHPATVRTWREKSRNGTKGVYQGFEDEVLKAVAEGEAMHVARVAEAGRTNWRASAWLLERINPAKWGLPEISPEEADSGPPPPSNPLADL